MKVCIVGDSGLLGQALAQQIAKNAQNEVFGVASSTFTPTPFWRPLRGYYEHKVIDLLKEGKTFSSWYRKLQAQLLINCVGLVRLEECERNESLAEKINGELPGFLARVASEEGADFIHFSTDQVFDGTKHAPYSEKDPVNPLHAYGRTKLRGEQNAGESHPRTLIVRTNFVGFRDRPDRATFVEWLVGALVEKRGVTLFDDYFTSSIHVKRLCDLVLKAYKKGLSGIYHFATRDSVSKYQFGEMLSQRLGLSFSSVRRGKLEEAGLNPKRPAYLGLDVGRAEAALGERFPQVTDTLCELAKDWKLRTELPAHVRN